MGLADSWIMGGVEYEQEKTNKLLQRQNELLEDSAKRELIEEMRQQGMILPQYDWSNKEFNDTLEAITADWFERHPETKRGTGEFQAKYPQKEEGLSLLEKMGGMGRITPDEFIVLWREIYNF